MNIQLTESIIKHILSNFLIIPSNNINSVKTNSLLSKNYLLNEKIKSDNEDNTITTNDVYGCQLSIKDKEIKILASNCSIDKNIPEFCLIMQLKDAPIYGIYLVYNEFDKNISSDPLIACSLDGKSWMPCSTYLQATFLAGMEELKESGLSWSLCSNYEKNFQDMVSFLQYYSDFYEVMYAREEN